MQIAESEIVIAVTYRSYYKRVFLISSVAVVCFIGLFIVMMNRLVSTGANIGHLPAFQERFHQEILVFTGFLVFILVLYSLTLIILIRQTRVPSPDLRINQEGIYTSPSALLIRWSEIRVISRASILGSPYLQIVLCKRDGVISRAKASSRPSVRWSIPLALMTSKSPVLMAVTQLALPVSVDELLTTIQEHFAPELREHHITVRGSQQQTIFSNTDSISD